MTEKNVDEMIFVTNETYADRKKDAADEEVLNVAEGGEGGIVLTPELFVELMDGARKTYSLFNATINELLTEERMEFVRKVRCVENGTYRTVARRCYEEWELTAKAWAPPFNQIAGVVLCEKSAKYFGEALDAPPWK